MTRGGSPATSSARPAAAAETTRDLYTRHGQRVYSFCASRLRNPEEAQDAVQTTFVYVLSAFNRGVVPRNELAWLLTIADNVCRSTRRSLGRRLARLVDTDVDELAAAATSLGAETNETLDALTAAIADLPANQRQAILLREWQGLSYADIADELGLSVAAVETLLFRARRSLASRLERSRERLRALDLGSLLGLIRSALGGAAGKVAVGAAGVAIVAAVPVVEREARATAPPKAAPPTTPSATRAPVVRHPGVSRPRAHRAAPAHAARRRSVRPRMTRTPGARPSVTTVRGRPQPPAVAPPPPAAASAARPAPAAAPAPVTARVAPPVQPPAAVQPVVTTVTQTVGTVVSTAANTPQVPAVPVPPAPVLPVTPPKLP